MAAELTDHVLTADELLRYRVPPPRWAPLKQRGRPSKDIKVDKTVVLGHHD